METLTTQINGLRDQLNAIQAKIPAKDSNSALSVAKNEAKALFDSLLNQKKALQAKRKAMFDEIGNLRNGIKKKGEEIKNSRDKLGYKSVADIDALVSEYEGDLRRGGLSLPEEKKIVAELSKLKQARKTLDGLNSQPAGIEGDKQKIDSVKAQMDAIEKEVKALDPQLTEAKEKLTTAEKALKVSYGSISSLLDNKKDLTTQLNAAKEAKNALYQSFKASQDAWFAWEREEKKRRAEADKVARAAEREARLVAQAERELEEADVAAYMNEIATCDALVKYFKAQGHLDEKSAAVAATQDNASIESSKPNARATVLPRKGDRDEEEFIVLGKKNKKNRPASAAPQTKAIRMDLELIDLLSKLSIEIPKTTADAPKTIEAILEKKQYFLDNSAAQTAANKEAALEKVKKLRAEAQASEAAEE
ncbi:hypothetical protein HDU91_000094 [Kappamyces sp. JEL0680]|nr:hypothetical protein HDU91_000094 [Kappamyces sp. JEL0680]